MFRAANHVDGRTFIADADALMNTSLMHIRSLLLFCLSSLFCSVSRRYSLPSRLVSHWCYCRHCCCSSVSLSLCLVPAFCLRNPAVQSEQAFHTCITEAGRHTDFSSPTIESSAHASLTRSRSHTRLSFLHRVPVPLPPPPLLIRLVSSHSRALPLATLMILK